MTKNYVFCFLVITSLIFACRKRPGQSLSDGILFTIDNQPVLAEEFIYLYEKNNFNNDSIYTQEDIRSYLDLFINFKLKVKAAYEAGIDTTAAFREEFNTYKAELIKPYLLETQQTDSLVKEAYERLQKFVHASHILVQVKDFDNPEDTLEAHQKISEIWQKALDGEDFEELAMEFSEDPSAKKNGGDLGFFTAMRMVYPFEDAAYQTEVGKISDIVKTQFGYHILKVHEVIPNRGKVQIAHIMVRNDENDPGKAKEKIFEIHDKAITGGDWNYLASQFSDDERTKSQGGELGLMGQGQLPPDFSGFEEMAFQLDSIGEISGPVESPYGWHIIKLLRVQSPQSFDEMKDQLTRQIARGDRAQVKKGEVMERLKTSGNLIENKEVYNQIVAFADSSLIAGNWKNPIPDSLQNKTLFLLNRQSVPARQFTVYMVENQKKTPNVSPKDYFKKLYDSFVEKRLFEYEEQQIASQHLDYRMLEKEYREGLLLFEVMEDHVWNKSIEDTIELRKYYQEHREKYKADSSVEAVIAKMTDVNLAAEISSELAGERFTYFETPAGEITTEVMDNALQQSKKYPSTTFIIEYNPKGVSSDEVEVIKNELVAKGIPRETIEVMESNGASTLKLSSSSATSLEEKYNKSSSLTLQVEEGLFEKGESEILDKLKWREGIYTYNEGEMTYVVKIASVLPERIRKLEEIKGKVISDYQNQLEQDWISQLKTKYNVVVNEDVLNKIYRYFENK